MLQTVASMITAIGVVFGGVSLRNSQLQRHRQFESLYVQRYWTLTDRFTCKIVFGCGGEELSPEEEALVLAYLRLCEDQLEMRQLGWITKHTHRAWVKGMLLQLEQRPFAEVLASYPNEDRGPSRFELLRDIGRRPDPVRASAPVRWIRGV